MSLGFVSVNLCLRDNHKRIQVKFSKLRAVYNSVASTASFSEAPLKPLQRQFFATDLSPISPMVSIQRLLSIPSQFLFISFSMNTCSITGPLKLCKVWSMNCTNNSLANYFIAVFFSIFDTFESTVSTFIDRGTLVPLTPFDYVLYLLKFT